MYYILYKGFMQIMNVAKLIKDLWWTLTAYKTINDLPDSLIFVDSDGFITKFNAKAHEVFGLQNDEIVPKRFNDIIDNGMKFVKASLDASKPILAMAKIPGREFYVELNASKKGLGYCISLRDMTKLTNELINEDKTIRFNNEKNAMLAKLEGDIKSPITSISGFSKGLLDGLGGELTEKQTKYVKIINSNADELYQFMDKLIEFSKAESSIYEENYNTFDIVELFKSISRDFENVISQKEISFDFDYYSLEKRNVYTDMNAVKTIYRNILEVVLSMTESGFISVRLTHPDEMTCIKYKLYIKKKKQKSYMQLTISASDSGIAEDDMKYLCEPYAQLEKGKKNFLRALKLGTASILTKRANGLISIKSEIMKGTKYCIVLPIEKE